MFVDTIIFRGPVSERSNRNTMQDMCHLKFFGRHVKKKQKGVNFNNMFCSNISQTLSFQDILNIKLLIRYFTFFYFLILSLQNLVCILHLQRISVWTSHTSSTQQSFIANGYYY